MSDIIAIGAGRALIQEEENPLHEYVLGLSDAAKPNLGFLPTASGDDPTFIELFYSTYEKHNCSPDTLLLFYRKVIDLKVWFDTQDIIYVGGGNTANMMLIWRLHGIDVLLKEFLDRGGICYGGSAGAICWFDGGITDSFGPDDLQPLNDGLHYLEGSMCPHYDSELNRPRYYFDALRENKLEAGYGVDNFAAIHFKNKQPVAGLASHPDAKAYRVDQDCSEHPFDMQELF